MMTDAFDAEPAPSVVASALRKKIGWLCQLIRFAAIVWLAWILYLVVSFWGDRDQSRRRLRQEIRLRAGVAARLELFFRLRAGTGRLGDHRRAGGGALAAVLALSPRRHLYGFGGVSLRRLAGVGAAALIFNTLQRPFVFLLMTAGHDGGAQIPFVQPNDLLYASFVTFLFSLAYIFKMRRNWPKTTPRSCERYADHRQPRRHARQTKNALARPRRAHRHRRTASSPA